MEIKVPYGRSFLTAKIPNDYNVDIIETKAIPPVADPISLIQSALHNLLGDLSWVNFSQTCSVGIAINDKTRPVPHHLLLPPLLERIAGLGIPNSQVTLYIAVGAHPPMTLNEFPSILPIDILQRYQVVSHASENEELLVYLGRTSHGTPIWVNKDYYQSDFKIVIGNIEPHQFAGFSGGVKTAAIGLAGLKTITNNHSMMTHTDAKLGEYETNPARQDIEEIGKKIVVHLALNAILNKDYQIVHALAGTPREVMQAGVGLSRKVCQVAVSHKYGLVISSPGGHPKDINVYQSQKGLAHAALVTRSGGTIILTAACPEGAGSMHYETWMRDKNSYADVLKCFSAEGFRIGPHKAYQIARDASQVRLLFCSEMGSAFASALLFNPVQDLQTAIDMSLADMQPGEHIGIIPHASSTIPYIHK